MSPAPTASPNEPHAPATQQPKFSWETIITTTPVILTVLATILAGASSGEMTQAQYHRALAAQNQSKVTDQWSFFQFKRTRRMLGERALDLMPGVPAKVTPAGLQAAFEHMADRLQRGQEQAGRLVKAVDEGKAGLSQAGPPLQQAAEALRATAAEKTTEAKRAAQAVRVEVGRDEVKQGFAYLGTDRLPQAPEREINDPDIQKALKEIADGQHESALAPVVLRIPDDRLQQAIDAAADSAKAFETKGKAIDRSFGQLDRLVRKQRQLVHAFHRAAGTLEEVVADVPAGKRNHDQVRSAAAAVVATDAAVQKAMGEPQDYLAAREDYNARRNDLEARHNQETAGLYEIQVHKSSVTSDRHRTRSTNFFYGMLCAQAGVSIASLSLAARRKSTLWALAGFAGVTAVAFSTYVYLYM
ncbi:MAG TPA: DUF4337 family protein [Gemmataceae bacterium]|jgi:hypothetical protein|nr:DUF4337 family protein [Gemmataceae bacterium]